MIKKDKVKSFFVIFLNVTFKGLQRGAIITKKISYLFIKGSKRNNNKKSLRFLKRELLRYIDFGKRLTGGIS